MGPLEPELGGEWESAKLHIVLNVIVDENLRAIHWSVTSRRPGGRQLASVVRPVADLPFPKGLGEALAEVLRQHEANATWPPFN